jgi:hypothetical protein
VNCYVASSDVASSVVASCVVANCVVASCYVATTWLHEKHGCANREGRITESLSEKRVPLRLRE